MKVYVLRIEDMWAHGDDNDCCCTVYDLHGVYSSREKAEAEIDRLRLEKAKAGLRFNPFYDIEEMEVQAVGGEGGTGDPFSTP